jgi:hypothetical protein
VLHLEVTGPNDATAIARARALARAYLSFRASQLRSQLAALNRGYEKRVASLREQAADLKQEFDSLKADDPGDPGVGERISALVSRQAQVRAEIESIQRSVRDASLKTNSIIDASYVLDPAAGKPQPSRLKPLLLAMASGAIGGTAIGVGLVLTSALVSGRLRLREEVALALDAPVRVSVGNPKPHRSWWPLHRDGHSASALSLLVDALDQHVARPAGTRKHRPTRLALATVDNPEAGELVLEHLAARLTDQGLSVVVLDLSTSGALTETLTRFPAERRDDGPRGPMVHRPDRVPSLVHTSDSVRGTSPAPRSAAGVAGGATPPADVVLALVEVDPALGLEHLASWVDDVVVLVTAGRSSAQRLRTTGELVRAAGLRLPFAIMVGADRGDESLGLPTTDSESRRRASVS